MERLSLKEITQLVRGAKDKDQRSIEALYKIYYPKMKGVCIKVIKTDEDIVHDLVQNAFLHALASLNTLNNEERFGEWLTTITRNVSLKYLQQKNKIHFIPLAELSDAEADYLSSQEETPESLLYRSEIESLIQQLPKVYSEVFRLYVIEGYTHLEIAQMLGIKPHSSSSQLARAKALLRRILKENGVVVTVLFLLIAVPCGILWMYHGKSEKSELAEDTQKQEYIYIYIYIMSVLLFHLTLSGRSHNSRNHCLPRAHRNGPSSFRRTAWPTASVRQKTFPTALSCVIPQVLQHPNWQKRKTPW